VHRLEAGFGNPNHFAQLHVGAFVWRNDTGLHDNDHIGFKAYVGNGSRGPHLGAQHGRPVAAAKSMSPIMSLRRRFPASKRLF